MNQARLLKLIVGLTLVVLLASLGLRFAKPGKPETRPTSSPSTAEIVSPAPLRIEPVAPPTPLVPPGAEMAEAEASPLHLAPEKVAEYLFKHHRSAASLLAGYRASQDTNLLAEAAATFPNDPQVQLALLNSEMLRPGERRQWLDAFKHSSPDNSLADYLSAAEHFKSGNPEAALKDIAAASGKGQFKDFSLEALMDEQELLRYAGEDPLASMYAGAWGGDLLRMLAPLKQVANGIVESQTQYTQAGDATSAEQLLQMGLGLADRLDSGDGGRFLISQLVGMAIEGRMLKQLDATTPYEALGGRTPTERLEELKRQKAEYRELTGLLPNAQASLSPEEWVNFSDRMKAYGEVAAMRWLQQRLANATAR